MQILINEITCTCFKKPCREDKLEKMYCTYIYTHKYIYAQTQYVPWTHTKWYMYKVCHCTIVFIAKY